MKTLSKCKSPATSESRHHENPFPLWATAWVCIRSLPCRASLFHLFFRNPRCTWLRTSGNDASGSQSRRKIEEKERFVSRAAFFSSRLCSRSGQAWPRYRFGSCPICSGRLPRLLAVEKCACCILAWPCGIEPWFWCSVDCFIFASCYVWPKIKPYLQLLSHRPSLAMVASRCAVRRCLRLQRVDFIARRVALLFPNSLGAHGYGRHRKTTRAEAKAEERSRKKKKS